MIIYDFGANKGQNIKYYLSKKIKVVAIEANPDLCDLIRSKFKREVQEHKLIVLNNYLSETSNGLLVYFYVHKTRSVLSQQKSCLQSLKKFKL